MPFEEHEITDAQRSQQQRRESFAARTADRVQTANNCLFSLLPLDELERLAGGWYEACAQAMLRGNFAATDQWTRRLLEQAGEEGFSLEDVLKLLRIFRSSAVETERWSEDILAEVDGVIFDAVGGSSGWQESPGEGSPEVTQGGFGSSGPNPGTEERTSERRIFGRNRLQLPIRIRSAGGGSESQEITRTRSISRGGLYFVTRGNYKAEQLLKISYPYWTDPGAINREYSAKVVRLDRLPDGSQGVAIHFLESLNGKKK